MNIEKLVSLCENKELCNIFDKYIQSSIQEGKDKEITFEFMFKKIQKDLSNSKCIIPILGVQGSGKSSFLNSLLFDDIILPVDADETTCIPTEICYGQNSELQAKVYFSDNKVKILEKCNEETLSEYVHQEHNPGNKKNISRIEIISNNELLKNNITFVDLPGVGSITLANENVTVQYLKNFANAAILVIRTVPPITNSESIFIQSALPMLGKIFLLQNRWTDETKAEVEDSKDHNYKVLIDIAKKLNLPDSKIQEPSVVCVKHALDGKMKNDDNEKRDLIKKSGLNDFIEKIIDFAKNHRIELNNNWVEKINKWLVTTEETIKERKKILSTDKENALKQIKDRKKQQEKELNSKEEKLNDIKKYLNDEKRVLNDTIDACCNKGKIELKIKVAEQINNGLTGGDQLNKAFNDNLEDVNADIFNTIQTEISRITNNISQQLSHFNSSYLKNVSVDINSNFSEQTQVHSTYGRIGSGGGAMGGAAIGAIIGGPIGAVFGSLIGGLGGWFAGNTIKEYQIESQKLSAMQELNTVVNNYEKIAKSNYKKAFSDFVQNLEKNIDIWLEQEQDKISQLYKDDKKKLNIPVEQKEKELLELDIDSKFVEKFKQEFI